jgi:hypothetical protein
MDKKKIIILTIISIILSVIMILVSYFGIIRYFTLHIKSSEGFINNYKNLDRADKSRVVISFTTTPDNISKIKPMLNSILDQTVRVDQIALNIPYKYKGKNYEIPKEYEKILSIFRFEKDYEDCAKYIPTLLREGEVGTKIIYLDDNQIYGKDFIEFLVEESNNNPDKAIYTKENMNSSGGVLIKPEFFNCNILGRDTEILDFNCWVSTNLCVQKKKVNYIETFKIINL